MHPDLTSVTNAEAKRFLLQFFKDRAINKEFYEKIPENRFDFRIVDTPERKSDSPRESIAHQIDTERDYVNGVKIGELKFGIVYNDLARPIKLTKSELLEKLRDEDNKLVKALSNKDIAEKAVKVPWAKEPIRALSIVWALDSHEILHTGWNLAVMDCLGIERFQKLKEMWG